MYPFFRTSGYLCFSVFLISLLFFSPVWSQQQDKAVYKDPSSSYYYQTIVPSIQRFESSQQYGKSNKKFAVDLSGRKLPTDPSGYNSVWHHTPVSQGRTGTCWCYSTTSFYESEVKRLTGKEIKLSEMYIVYWEYVERARLFVEKRGEMFFGEGSETNAVARMMQKYGMVPAELYTGLKKGQPFHNHSPMFKELDAYLKSVKLLNAWDEHTVVSTTKSILNHYLGTPPENVSVDGKTYSPLTYMQKFLKLRPDEYVNFMSLMESPYYKKAVYNVPDNWWGSNEYFNVPLNEFMTGLQGALEQGFSISIGGDVSEAGLDKQLQVGIIPSFDIPSAYINESARQFRFNNESTTDDHAMHVVGYREFEDSNWFLVKDSGSGSRNCGEGCKQFGYYFFHEDFVKLKMMNFTVHKDAVKDLLRKCNAL